MIDYEKLNFWLGCQIDDIQEAYDEKPSEYLYGALKAYKCISSQLNMVWANCVEADIQTNQHEVDVDRCQHEIDYGHKLLNPLQQICKKCGEFYK